MNISIWDIFRYLYKWKFIIAAVIVLAILGAYKYVDSHQTYNAQIVLQYNDECVSSGKAPDDSKFDPYEIASPNVITGVIKELGLKKTVDNIRSSIKISPIIPDSETAIKESKEKTGEKYEYFPNTFSIAYIGKVGESQNEVRDILDSVVQNYMKFYTQKYLKQASINDVAYDEDIGNYDYVEIAEILSANLDDTTAAFKNYYDADARFRSSSTGLTFSDINKEYDHLQQFTMPKLFSDIYRGQISKNKQRLIEKYTQVKENFLLSKQNYTEQADLARNRMDGFAQANKLVPNAYNSTTDSNNDNIEIIDGISKNTTYYNTTTTYDTLINNYTDKCIAVNNSQLQADNCEKTISKFQAPLDENVDVKGLTVEVENMIKEAKIKIVELNRLAKLTIEDYNAYTATKHLSILTGVKYYSTLSFSLYALIALVVGTAFSVLASITTEILFEIKKFNKKKKEDQDDNSDENDETDTEMI